MEELETELKGFVGRELHELSWRNNYPINPALGLWAFFEAFRGRGIEVVTDSVKRVARFNVLADVRRGEELLSTDLTFDEIRKGWNHCPPGCMRSFYDSMYLIFDRIGEQLKDPNKPCAFTKPQNVWDEVRNAVPRQLRQRMEEIILPYFHEYHEHMLIPVGGKVPELVKPVLFYKVLKHFPLDVMRNAEIRDREHQGVRCGPCPETLVDMDELDFDEDYHPSSHTMDSYFWGIYLNALAKEKGYPLMSKDYGLREVVASHERVLKNGSQIEWACS